jgi:hypothetical protein
MEEDCSSFLRSRKFLDSKLHTGIICPRGETIWIHRQISARKRSQAMGIFAIWLAAGLISFLPSYGSGGAMTVVRPERAEWGGGIFGIVQSEASC